MTLIEKIKEKKMSIAEVSYKCDVDPLTIRNWCSGRTSPSIVKEYTLSKVLNITLDEMNAILRETRQCVNQ